MYNSRNLTTSGQPCDTTTGYQHPVSTPVTQSASDQQVSTQSVLSKLVTAGARACAGAREETPEDGIITPDVLTAIRDAYVTYTGSDMTAMVAREIEDALSDGMSPSVVIEAAKTTGDAPRPTPYYMRAVLRRWRRDHILTEDALAADRAAFEAQQTRNDGQWWARRNPALMYDQRPCPPQEELDKLLYRPWEDAAAGKDAPPNVCTPHPDT